MLIKIEFKKSLKSSRAEQFSILICVILCKKLTKGGKEK